MLSSRSQPITVMPPQRFTHFTGVSSVLSQSHLPLQRVVNFPQTIQHFSRPMTVVQLPQQVRRQVVVQPRQLAFIAQPATVQLSSIVPQNLPLMTRRIQNSTVTLGSPRQSTPIGLYQSQVRLVTDAQVIRQTSPLPSTRLFTSQVRLVSPTRSVVSPTRRVVSPARSVVVSQITTSQVVPSMITSRIMLGNRANSPSSLSIIVPSSVTVTSNLRSIPLSPSSGGMSLKARIHRREIESLIKRSKDILETQGQSQLRFSSIRTSATVGEDFTEQDTIGQKQREELDARFHAFELRRLKFQDQLKKHDLQHSTEQNSTKSSFPFTQPRQNHQVVQVNNKINNPEVSQKHSKVTETQRQEAYYVAEDLDQRYQTAFNEANQEDMEESYRRQIQFEEEQQQQLDVDQDEQEEGDEEYEEEDKEEQQYEDEDTGNALEAEEGQDEEDNQEQLSEVNEYEQQQQEQQYEDEGLEVGEDGDIYEEDQKFSHEELRAHVYKSKEEFYQRTRQQQQQQQQHQHEPSQLQQNLPQAPEEYNLLEEEEGQGYYVDQEEEYESEGEEDQEEGELEGQDDDQHHYQNEYNHQEGQREEYDEEEEQVSYEEDEEEAANRRHHVLLQEEREREQQQHNLIEQTMQIELQRLRQSGFSNK